MREYRAAFSRREFADKRCDESLGAAAAAPERKSVSDFGQEFLNEFARTCLAADVVRNRTQNWR